MIVKTSGNRLCHGGRIDHTASALLSPAQPCSRVRSEAVALRCAAVPAAAPRRAERGERAAVCETHAARPRAARSRARRAAAVQARSVPGDTHTRARLESPPPRRCPAPPTAHRRRATAQTRDGAERLGPISRHGVREDAHTWVPARVSPLLASAPLWFGSGSSGAVEGSSLDGLLLDGQLLGHGAVEHLQPAARAAADARVQLRLGGLHVEK